MTKALFLKNINSAEDIHILIIGKPSYVLITCYSSS